MSGFLTVIYDIQSVGKTYPGQPRPAVDDMTFQIRQGEIFGFLGDNGAGKSTLVKMMANLLRPTAGAVRLHEQPVQADPTRIAMTLGYMPQTWQSLNPLNRGRGAALHGPPARAKHGRSQSRARSAHRAVAARPHPQEPQLAPFRR